MTPIDKLPDWCKTVDRAILIRQPRASWIANGEVRFLDCCRPISNKHGGPVAIYAGDLPTWLHFAEPAAHPVGAIVGFARELLCGRPEELPARVWDCEMRGPWTVVFGERVLCESIRITWPTEAGMPFAEGDCWCWGGLQSILPRREDVSKRRITLSGSYRSL